MVDGTSDPPCGRSGQSGRRFRESVLYDQPYAWDLDLNLARGRSGRTWPQVWEKCFWGVSDSPRALPASDRGWSRQSGRRYRKVFERHTSTGRLCRKLRPPLSARPRHGRHTPWATLPGPVAASGRSGRALIFPHSLTTLGSSGSTIRVAHLQDLGVPLRLVV